MIKIKKLIKTCNMCPSQWEGITENNEPIYIRYRYGGLTVQVGKPNETINDAIDAEYLLDIDYGNEWDGILKTKEMLKLVKNVISYNSLITKNIDLFQDFLSRLKSTLKRIKNNMYFD